MTAIKRSWQSTKERALAGLVRARDRWMYTDSALAGCKWPVRGPTGRRPPFFVLGSPRSGTTLLRAILSAHPDVFIPPENGALGSMIRVFGARRSSDWEDVVDAVFDKFTGGYEYAFWEVDIESVRKKAKVMPQNERSLAALLQHLYIEYGRLKAPGKRIWGDKTTPGGFHFVYKVGADLPGCSLHSYRSRRPRLCDVVRPSGFLQQELPRCSLRLARQRAFVPQIRALGERAFPRAPLRRPGHVVASTDRADLFLSNHRDRASDARAP